jgi:hypothetical protein
MRPKWPILLLDSGSPVRSGCVVDPEAWAAPGRPRVQEQNRALAAQVAGFVSGFGVSRGEVRGGLTPRLGVTADPESRSKIEHVGPKWPILFLDSGSFFGNPLVPLCHVLHFERDTLLLDSRGRLRRTRPSIMLKRPTSPEHRRARFQLYLRVRVLSLHLLQNLHR